MGSSIQHRLSISVAALVLVTICPRQGTAQVAPQTQMIVAADGVKLATDVYLPPNGTPPFSTILIRTPYNKGKVQAVANNFCAQGYAAVVQDVRGRFASEGPHAIIY